MTFVLRNTANTTSAKEAPSTRGFAAWCTFPTSATHSKAADERERALEMRSDTC